MGLPWTGQESGTAKEPIIIEAESVGGVQIQGTGGLALEASAAYLVIRGFKFTHTAVTIRVPVGVHHCRIMRNVFQLAVRNGGKAAYLVVSGDDNEIDHNLFQHKATEGQMLYVQGPGTDGMAQHTWIHHNYFFDFKPSANNCSALHIGHSARSLGSTDLVLANNLIVGGNRAVSIDGPLTNPKWTGNIVWNTEGGAGDMPEAGFAVRDPKLKRDATGVFRLSPGSPVIGNGQNDFSYVTVDIDGQERWSKLDIGADQLSNQPVVNRVLTVKDVGPDAPEIERPLVR